MSVVEARAIASRPACRRRSTCRSCGGRRLEPFLSLGPVPPANAFLRNEDDLVGERRFPLDVYFCRECALVQLLDVVDRRVLFEEYPYVTGTSARMRAHWRAYAEAVVEELRLAPEDLVVEIGSNDGTLLRGFDERGMRTVGVEPAANIAEMARAAGIETVVEFFDRDVAARLRRRKGPARAVVANNVLAHVDEPRDFLAGCRDLLAPEGALVVEVPHLGPLVERLEYDTIYHEHLSYFSVTALIRLFETAGLRVVRVDPVPVHGGSIRVWARGTDAAGDPAREVGEAIGREREAGLASLETFRRFAAGVERNRDALRELLGRLREAGRTIAGYGAPAKGNTLLNYCDVGTDLVGFTVDRNPLKVGTRTPGTHIPVRPVEALLEERPDFCLLLAWNLADEILEQQRPYRAAGGRFIVPIPEPEVLS